MGKRSQLAGVEFHLSFCILSLSKILRARKSSTSNNRFFPDFAFNITRRKKLKKLYYKREMLKIKILLLKTYCIKSKIMIRILKTHGFKLKTVIPKSTNISLFL